PFRPFARDDRLDLAPEPVAAALDLRLFDLHPAGLDGMNAHDVLRRHALTPAAAAEMGVAEGGRIFEAVAERAIEADMRDQDQAGARERRLRAEESREREQERQHVAVDE